MQSSQKETFLSQFMAQEQVKDQALANRVNQFFPELNISRRTIHNWRTGRSKTVRDWESFVATLRALHVTEAEADVALTEVGLLTIRQLAEMANGDNKQYLAYWLEKSETTLVDLSVEKEFASSEVSQPARRNWVPFLVVGFVIVIVVGVLVWQRPFTNTLTPSPQAQPPATTVPPTQTIEAAATVTTPPALLASDMVFENSFEAADELTDWQFRGDCGAEILTKEAGETLPNAERLVKVSNLEAKCLSFFQDIAIEPVVGDTYTFSIWVYDPNNVMLPGLITIWGLNANNDNPAGRFFTAYDEWHCYETNYIVASQETNRLRAEIYLTALNDKNYFFDYAKLGDEAFAGCPEQHPAPLHNNSFEAENAQPWKGVNNCVFWTEQDQLVAKNGSWLLNVQKNSEECDGIYQGVNGRFDSGDVYRFRAWVRHPLADLWSGELILHSPTAGLVTKPFTLENETDWQCVETAIIFENEELSELKAEIRFHTLQDVGYQIDDTLLTKSIEPLCPQPILDVDVTLSSLAPHYPNAALSILATVENNSEVSAMPGVLQGWIAAEEDGFPLDTSRIAERPFPNLSPGESSSQIYLEIYTLVDLPPGEYFVVVRTRPDTHYPEGNEPRTTISIPYTISPCITGTLFCDVGEDYWARTAIETWYDVGITKGCRSETAEFVNRPFCPSVLLDRAHFLIFLIRHQFDPDHAPPSVEEIPYQGYYFDVSSDYGLNRWIEEGYRLGLTLPIEDCAAPEGQLRFCPDAIVSRADFALHMAEIRGWELESVSQTPFIDVSPTHPAAPAIVYMWENGFIPEFEPDCLVEDGNLRFCPNQPLRRANAAVMMGEIYNLEDVAEP